MVRELANRTFMPRVITRPTVEIFHRLLWIQKACFCLATSVTIAWIAAVRGRFRWTILAAERNTFGCPLQMGISSGSEWENH
jgi:hypothetical protein